MLVLRSLFVFVLLGTSGAAAQNLVGSRSAPSAGITVVGRATVATAPDRARITVQVFGAVGAPSASSVPLDDAANALIDALHQNGVTDAHEVLPLGVLNTRNVTPAIVGTLAKPTRERLEEIARNVVKALPLRFAPAFANTQVQVALFIDDCDATEARAERAAFADAKLRAERLASAAGVHLGAVTAISDVVSPLPSGCAAKPDDVELNQALINVGANPYGPLVVPLTVNETVQFEIAGS